ncbi:hypothetical protein ABMA32_22945 [Mesorhizobium sp. VNQ89]|uniref:hypothetical protein n=1 Tax=Mesorhizobium quangtriensis TaxID=3157709 RepID=UPI0032B719C6
MKKIMSYVATTLLSAAMIDAAAASDAQLSATLLAARCPVANIEETYRSDAISVFKVDCKGRGDRRLVVTCTRAARAASSERNDDDEG